jgi:hypothetical protein
MQLAERLLAKTVKGELDWQRTENEDAYQVSLGDASVRIVENDYPGLQGYAYEVRVYNAEGVVVDSFTDRSLSQLGENPKSSGDWSLVLTELYALARRFALRTDEVLDDLLGRLGR